jgi:hypothetical protein
MDYLQSIHSQAAVFLKTVGFGFLLGGAYDLCRLVRLLTRSRRIAVWDIAFGAVSSAAAFLFALTQDGGRVRSYVLAAIGTGFAAWYFCAGVPIRSATDGILRSLHRAAAAARRPFDRLSAQLEKARGLLRRFAKKRIKSCKKNRKPS